MLQSGYHESRAAVRACQKDRRGNVPNFCVRLSDANRQGAVCQQQMPWHSLSTLPFSGRGHRRYNAFPPPAINGTHRSQSSWPDHHAVRNTFRSQLGAQRHLLTLRDGARLSLRSGATLFMGDQRGPQFKLRLCNRVLRASRSMCPCGRHARGMRQGVPA